MFKIYVGGWDLTFELLSRGNNRTIISCTWARPPLPPQVQTFFNILGAHARFQFYMKIPDLWQGVKCDCSNLNKITEHIWWKGWTNHSSFFSSETMLLDELILNCCNVKWGTNKHRPYQCMEVNCKVQPREIYPWYGLVKFLLW